MSERIARVLRPSALVAIVVAFLALGRIARADVPSPSPDPSATLAPAECRIVDASDAARIVGYPVDEPDSIFARGGVCYFATRSISDEGSLSYALVRMPLLRARRAYFIVASRRCGSVAEGASNERVCRLYRRLAEANDLDAYFTARTDASEAVALPKLGPHAIAAVDAIYIRRGETIFECAVRRGETLDVPRTAELARLLLRRVAQP